MLRAFIIAVSLLPWCSIAAAAKAELATVSEQSGFLRTGRYDEVVRLCADFAARWPQAVRCAEFGRTPENRPMLALIVSRSGALTPQNAAAKQLPVMLVQGGIHAGEIDGKDAGFLALRDALESKSDKLGLAKQVLVFVPVFNVDGHERFGAWNRPNQVGPAEMGWRTTAQNFNLNRDYTKADAPEMQAMLRLVNAWDPIVVADLHVTDGAKFRHDVSITLEPVASGDLGLREAGRALRGELVARLRKQGSLPLEFYPQFVDEDDPASGFEDSVPQARFSDGYFVLRNRFGVLVETHSWKDYPTRVRVTRNTIDALLDLNARNGAQWLALAAAADERASHLAGTDVPLSYKASDKVRTIDFLGYAYTRAPSDISGKLWTQYDDRRPQVWKVPLRDDLQPALSVKAPAVGYVVPPAQAAWMADKLALHGIVFRTLDAAPPGKIAAFRASAVLFDKLPFENHLAAHIEGRWSDEARAIAPGSLLVPVAQPKARLVMQLLEPQAADSFAAWGFFDIAFERKEYMEDYVAEQVAREMLGKDAALAAEFKRKLADDPAFAADSSARLDFFARRHASWDERLNLYPVLRVD